MKVKTTMFLLAMLVFACSARLLSEETPAEPAVEKKDPPAEGQATTEPKPEEKPADQPPATTEEKKEDAKPADAPKHDAGSKVAGGSKPAGKDDKKPEPRGKRFYILMAVSVLMIGAVCSAFILGKKKE